MGSWREHPAQSLHTGQQMACSSERDLGSHGKEGSRESNEKTGVKLLAQSLAHTKCVMKLPFYYYFYDIYNNNFNKT